VSKPKQTAPILQPKVCSKPAAGVLLGGVHRRSVDRLVQAGKLRQVHIGSRAMIVIDSIDELLATAAG
jgi:hypothetical protein